MGGGAWPFLVGGVICQVNSDNERDSSLLTRRTFDISKVGVGVVTVVQTVWRAARTIFTVGVQSILLRGTSGF